MNTDWLTYLRDFGASMYAVFIMPGDFLLSQLAERLPTLASMPAIGADDRSFFLSVVAASFSWFCAGFVVLAAVRLARNIACAVGAAIRTIAFRVSQAARNFKTWMVCKIRASVPRQRSAIACSAPEAKLDDLDMAVLRSAAACGPGYTTSAPELAERFRLRPAQIQSRLDRLRKLKLLDNVIGSTDGFDNYRLSLSGTAFMTMWERRHAGATMD